MRKLITPIVVLTLSALYAYALGGSSRNLFSVPLVWILIPYSLIVQVISSIPAIIFNTQKYYDITGSFTFISITIICFFTNSDLQIEQIIASLMVLIWAGRLGTFLFLRIVRMKEDSRFVEIKRTKIRFLYAWIIQGLWIVITMGPCLAIITSNKISDSNHLNLLEYAGIIVWIIGITIEAISDSQKSQFSKNPQNKDKFICTGLWSYSRHPNYVGEIVLWIGATIYAYSSLSGGQYITLFCPIFVYLLLSKLSGVPLLQKKGDAKWGNDASYQEYKSRTAVLFPFIPETPSSKKRQ